MPKPRLYHHFLRARITREQRQAIQEYAKRHGLRWGEAVRELIERALGEEKTYHRVQLVKKHEMTETRKVSKGKQE